jgi:hypothetical protein
MGKPIPDGRYLVGVDLGANDATGYWLVPFVRGQLMWVRARTLSEDEFRDFMEERHRRQRERAEIKRT